jgi:glucokinase
LYLQKKGLVKPVGRGRSNGGRPPNILRLDSKFGYVVGVEVGTALLRFNVADLNGRVLVKWAEATHSNSTPEQVSALVRKCLRRLQTEEKIPAKKLLALAVGVPGITDVATGVVLSAPILPTGWRNVPLRQILHKATGIPTQVENDVNLAAIAENWCGSAQGVKNFVFLAVEIGVGAGIVINGRLHHGTGWAAGEIGYLYLPGTTEDPLSIRRLGSLENMIGAKAIERSWRNLQSHNRKSNGRRLCRLAAIRILDLAAEGNINALKILQQETRNLADAIANICVVLDPSLIVFGGLIGSHSALFEATQQVLAQNEICRPRLALSVLGRGATALGAIWVALKSARDRILPLAVNNS